MPIDCKVAFGGVSRLRRAKREAPAFQDARQKPCFWPARRASAWRDATPNTTSENLNTTFTLVYQSICKKGYSFLTGILSKLLK